VGIVIRDHLAIARQADVELDHVGVDGDGVGEGLDGVLEGAVMHAPVRYDQFPVHHAAHLHHKTSASSLPPREPSQAGTEG
jgi:hypothetical protein